LPVRTATAADAPAIVDLVNAAFAVEKAFVDGERTSLDEIQRLLQSGIFLVADAENHAQPIACAYVEQRGFRAYLGMLSVDPSRQGDRVGSSDDDGGRTVLSRPPCAVDRYPHSQPQTRAAAVLPQAQFRRGGDCPYENPKSTRPGHFLLMSKNLD
jgi:hypothetical protein